MSERKAVTKKLALEYRRSDKAHKGELMNQVCALNGWHRSHARKALKQALTLKVVKPRPPRKSIYGAAVITALQFLWAVQGTRAGNPCGRLLAAALPDLVPPGASFACPTWNGRQGRHGHRDFPQLIAVPHRDLAARHHNLTDNESRWKPGVRVPLNPSPKQQRALRLSNASLPEKRLPATTVHRLPTCLRCRRTRRDR